MAGGSDCDPPLFVAHCHLGLGKLYRRTGKLEQAQEHLTTATTMYREMGMRFWLDKAEVELQALAEIMADKTTSISLGKPTRRA
jgi:hypothetical protein